MSKPSLGDQLSSASAGKNCALPMRLPDPSPVLDKNRAPMGPEMLFSTGAGVWRKSPVAFPNSSSVLDEFQKTFRYLWRFLLVTFSWLFRGFFVAPFCLEKLFHGFFAFFSWLLSWLFLWPPFWAKFTRTRPGTVFWEFPGISKPASCAKLAFCSLVASFETSQLHRLA